MTPAAALREHAARLEQEAAELRVLADTLEGEHERPQNTLALPAPTRTQEPREDLGRLVGISGAVRITGISENTLYRAATRFNVGWRLPAGGWKFSEARLRRFARGDVPVGGFGEICGIGEGARVDEALLLNHPAPQR